MSAHQNTPLEQLSGEDFRRQLVRVAADRHSPAAAALYRVLYDYTRQRVRRLAGRVRLQPSVQDEVTGDVLLMLMRGSLASFRGGSLAELLGFVRTITDRAVWRRVRDRDRERDALGEAGHVGMEHWTGQAPRAADQVELVAASPLPEPDQAYLVQLLRAGSKAELARQAGVSRAAVTQRVRRILQRVEALGARDRAAHEAWLEQRAADTLAAYGDGTLAV